MIAGRQSAEIHLIVLCPSEATPYGPSCLRAFVTSVVNHLAIQPAD